MQLLYILSLVGFATALLVTGPEYHRQPVRHTTEELSATGYIGSDVPADFRFTKIGMTCYFGAVAEFNFAKGADQTFIQDLRLPGFRTGTSADGRPGFLSYCSLTMLINTTGWQFRVVGKAGTVKVTVSASLPKGALVKYVVEYTMGTVLDDAHYSNVNASYTIGPGEGTGERTATIFEGNTADNEPDPNLTTGWSSCTRNETLLRISRNIIQGGNIELPSKAEVEAGIPFLNPSSLEWRKCP